MAEREIVGIPEFLTELHDRINRDKVLAGARKQMLRQQARLKAQCSAEAWQTYLRLEEVTNQREAKTLEILVSYFLTGDA